jgi:hypothetical protein
MEQTRVEVYDETGLIDVYYIDSNEPTTEELITQKEAELIEIYDEIQRLKNNR